MKAIKSAAASVKETLQNVVAKEEERGELSKATAQAKVERKAAENKAGKHDAISHFHSRQAEIIREYEQKKAQNKSVKEQTQAALHQPKANKKADKHADKKGAISEHEAESSPALASDTQSQPTGETLDDRDTSTPPASDIPEPASEERGETTDSNAEPASEERGETTDSNAPTSGEADPPPIDDSQIPMHGSGVPTHSEVHSDGSDAHDRNTTQTMGGSPNNESYM